MWPFPGYPPIDIGSVMPGLDRLWGIIAGRTRQRQICDRISKLAVSLPFGRARPINAQDLSGMAIAM
jgi:hypothetical protein